MTWQSVREDIVLDNPEYELALEQCSDGVHQMVFIHLWVKKEWSVKLLKRFIHEWRVLRKHITCPLFAGAVVDDDKWVKFIELFGFKPITEFHLDGQRRRIYWHNIDDQFNTENKLKLDQQREREFDDQPVRIPATVSEPSVSGSV